MLLPPATRTIAVTVRAQDGRSGRVNVEVEDGGDAAVDVAVDELADGIYVVGNAPTALLRLIERIDQGDLRPSLVVGLPVHLDGRVSRSCVVPIEMAAAGMVVITTNCLNKTAEKMAAISSMVTPEVAAMSPRKRSWLLTSPISVPDAIS